MKAKLLKKLREEAYQTYGIKGKMLLVDGGYLVVVGMRQFSNKEDVAAFDMAIAKKLLQKMRNDYCVKRVSEIRESRRISKYNKL